MLMSCVLVSGVHTWALPVFEAHVGARGAGVARGQPHAHPGHGLAFDQLAEMRLRGFGNIDHCPAACLVPPACAAACRTDSEVAGRGAYSSGPADSRSF